MEDLYGNLENYDEVNALAELKSENIHLKMKLKDYAGTMEKLQKDFELLSSEFKKLEYNYSSLLKTARSEIERKTQIITNMNMEKDLLVLEALKNGNRSVLHMKKNMPSYNINNDRKKGNGSVNNKNFQEAKEDKMQYGHKNEYDFGNNRSQEQPTSSSEKVNRDTMESTIHKPKKNNNVEHNTESCNYVSSHIKERTKYENIHNTVQLKSIDIKNRRKSIPATSLEGVEKVDSTNSQLDGFTKDKEDRRSFLKFDYDRHSSKSSRSSSRDERIFGYHKPSRDMYRGSNYKNDSYKHRIRDKYDTSQQHKRYSPERYNKKSSRDYYDENYHQPDFNRFRTQESPDRFHHNSYKEYRAHHDKNYNESDGYMHGSERYVAKHKIPYEYEEPYVKRPKPSYYGREKEDVMWNDKGIVEHQELTETFERLKDQYISCQSPDHIYDEIPTEPKVIMDTAETPLDDPRLATSKYILSYDNGSERLSTTVGSKVDLKPVDKVKWNLQTASMPSALTQTPLDEQLSKDLYSDFEEANPTPQINKGQTCINSQPIQNENIMKENLTEVEPNLINKPSCTIKDKLGVEKVKPGHLANYTIPKIKKNHPEKKSNKVIKDRSLEVIDALYANDNNVIDKQYSQSDSSGLPLKNLEKHGKIINNVKCCHKTRVLKNSVDEYDSPKVLSTREIVEGDLELSDETSDNTELPKLLDDNITEKNNSTIAVIQANPLDSNNLDKLSENEPSNNDKKFQEEKLLPFCDNEKEHTEYSKKQKSKKKTHKSNDSEHIKTDEKKSKVKKDKKEKPKVVTSKFNELFGDSNSLITPADLGIPVTHAPSSPQNTANYMPIFEDAQDATDLEQNIEVKTSKSKSIDNVNIIAENGDKIQVELDSQINDISKGPSEVKHYGKKVSNESVINTIHDNMILQNVNKESDVVTTIIISTGIQPDEINTESLVNAEELLSDDIERDQDNATHKTQNVLIKALATSTPCKQVHQIDSKLPESTCASNSTLTNADCADTLVSNRNNTMETQNEDLPDVRIFVKRKKFLNRRIVKTAN